MLKSFTVSNFRAFNNSVTIDFSATGNYSFNTEAIKDGVVKTALMYGRNASGKSSLGLALFDIVATLTDNYVNPQNYLNYKNRISTQPFVTFEYRFVFHGKEVVYLYKKIDSKQIISESFTIDGKVLIDYDRTKDREDIFIAFKGAENTNIPLKQLNFSALRFVKSNVLLAEYPFCRLVWTVT